MKIGELGFPRSGQRPHAVRGGPRSTRYAGRVRRGTRGTAFDAERGRTRPVYLKTNAASGYVAKISMLRLNIGSGMLRLSSCMLRLGLRLSDNKGLRLSRLSGRSEKSLIQAGRNYC